MAKKKDNYTWYFIDESEFFAKQDKMLDEIIEDIRKEYEAEGKDFDPIAFKKEYLRRVYEEANPSGEIPETQKKLTLKVNYLIEENDDWYVIKNGHVYPSDIAPVEAIRDYNQNLPLEKIPGYFITNDPLDYMDKLDFVRIEDFVKMRKRDNYTNAMIKEDLPLLYTEEAIKAAKLDL